MDYSFGDIIGILGIVFVCGLVSGLSIARFAVWMKDKDDYVNGL